MKRFLLATSFALIAASANAADLAPVYRKAPVAPVASWTGFYVGVNAGYGFSDPTVTYTPNDNNVVFISPPAQQASYDVSGALGGVQIGYNFQVSPGWLLGIEADFQGSGIKGSVVSPFKFRSDPAAVAADQNVEWFGTVRGRVGWLANDKLLIFGTGGLAYGSVKENLSLSMTSPFASSNAGGGVSYDCIGFPIGCFNGNSTQTLVGYTAGGGIEFAAMSNWTVKIEYLYVNLGSSDTKLVAHPLPPNAPASYNAHFSDLHFNVVRGGINYRF